MFHVKHFKREIKALTKKANAKIDKDDVETWENQLEYFLLNRHKYNRKQISTSASNYFSNEKIKKQYLEFIHDID